MSTNAHTEVEITFAATADTPLPDLREAFGASAGEVVGETTAIHHLSAVYFDTEDLRLTRRKITLRRRTGGNDAGWHLKLPKQGATRIELRAELGSSDTPPAELLAPVRSLVRNLTLVPIAQVDNERHETVFADEAGQAIAEFCDDHVTAWSLLSGGDRSTWREWEVEIGTAHLDNADALLAAATTALTATGAEPADSPSKLATALGDSIHNAPEPPGVADLPAKSPASAVIQALAANRDRLVAIDPAVRRDEHDSVHDMRVATRELRSHLGTFSGIIDTDAQLPGELKHLATVLGHARDAEVVGERFSTLAHTLPQPAPARLATSMNDAYRHAHQQAVEFLDSPRYFELLASLDEAIANPQVHSRKTKTAEKVLAKHLAEAYERLTQRHNKATQQRGDANVAQHQQENNFHDVRKAVKRLRYSAEAAGQATKLKTHKLYDACKTMQTILGDFQDAITSRDALARIAEQAHQEGENTFPYGVLYQREQQAAWDALDDYDSAFEEIQRSYRKLMKKM